MQPFTEFSNPQSTSCIANMQLNSPPEQRTVVVALVPLAFQITSSSRFSPRKYQWPVVQVICCGLKRLQPFLLKEMQMGTLFSAGMLVPEPWIKTHQNMLFKHGFATEKLCGSHEKSQRLSYQPHSQKKPQHWDCGAGRQKIPHGSNLERQEWLQNLDKSTSVASLMDVFCSIGQICSKQTPKHNKTMCSSLPERANWDISCSQWRSRLHRHTISSQASGETSVFQQ